MTDVHGSPIGLVERFVAAFNGGDLAALDRLYAPDGVVVPVPGQVSGDRVGALRHLMSLGGVMTASVRRCLVVGDVGLLVVDWAVGGMAGVAADVVWWDGDSWRYLIDNPHGVG